MEEFFLRAVLAGDELHVINHQHVNSAENLLEIHHLAVAQSLHETIHELFCGQIDHVQIGSFRLQFPSNRVHQVGLAQPDAAIEEERVERDRATLGHAARGGMCQFVGFAYDETVKGKSPVQRRTRQLIGGKRRDGGFFLGHGGRDGGRRALRGIGGHAEIHAAHGLAGLGQLVQNQIPEILRDIIAQKIGRDMERGDTFRNLVEFKRLDPVGIIVLAHRAEKFPL